MTMGRALLIPNWGRVSSYYQKVLGYSPIAYWPLWEASGSIAECLVNPAQNGAYTGVTLGQPGIGDGQTCPLFDGVNDFVSIYTAVLAAAFNKDTGTIGGWVKAYNQDFWDSGTGLIIHLGEDVGNRLFIHNPTDQATLAGYYIPGPVGKNKTNMTELGWFHTAVTWDTGADEWKLYYNGIQEGAAASGLGAYAGTLTDAWSAIGSYNGTSPGEPWYGWLAHMAIWDTVLPPAQIADLAVV